MMRHCATIAAALWLSGPALSQDQSAAERYELIPLQDGLLRVDKKTGEVSRCSDASGPLTCRLLPDERMAYEAEIDRLHTRLDNVEKDLAALQSEFDAAAEAIEEDTIPAEEEIDRFVDLAEQIMRRFFGLVKELKDETDPSEL